MDFTEIVLGIHNRVRQVLTSCKKGVLELEEQSGVSRKKMIDFVSLLERECQMI